ncbi:hypothetical protein Bbelb_095130 [Branchiostoma belcheri]|nr:hypothetical protein Bbelb_095130 [Branchiostoma belcheri]
MSCRALNFGYLFSIGYGISELGEACWEVTSSGELLFDGCHGSGRDVSEPSGVDLPRVNNILETLPRPRPVLPLPRTDIHVTQVGILNDRLGRDNLVASTRLGEAVERLEIGQIREIAYQAASRSLVEAKQRQPRSFQVTDFSDSQTCRKDVHVPGTTLYLLLWDGTEPCVCKPTAQVLQTRGLWWSWHRTLVVTQNWDTRPVTGTSFKKERRANFRDFVVEDSADHLVVRETREDTCRQGDCDCDPESG